VTQTYRNIELILFDDSSTDGSWAKIQTYLPRLGAAFPRVVCERHANVGPFEELAQAIEHATGKYLCILDSDDYYLPTKIEENVAYLENHPQAGLVHSAIEHVRADGTPHSYRGTTDVPSGYVLEQLLERNFINTCAACCRTDLVRHCADLRDYLARGYLMADYPIWLRIARAWEIGYIPKVLCRYRVLDESASRSKCPHHRYRFAKSFDEIKLDVIREYNIDLPVVEKVLRAKHITLYYGGYTLLEEADCVRGYSWLVENCPQEFATWKQRARMLVIGNRTVWRTVRSIEEFPLVRKLLGWNRIAP
jgi:glycosyltransferase involved in cell wall biosynthesis